MRCHSFENSTRTTMKIAFLLAVLGVGLVSCEQCQVDADCTHTHCTADASGYKMFCEHGVCLCDHNFPCKLPSDCQSHFGSCSSGGFLGGAWHCVDSSCSCSHSGGGIGDCLNGNIQHCLGIIGGIGKK
ncbi:serine protease inhibitor Cvsi-2-like [Dreissena polymorpha]|uniref:serine protease inhibitor Cvsi-2-like n=1 Tax=Dreissena polymorpha TaxID=45954 RepID=UPI002264E5CC|nr:serine protease inhibitor Cvsi-2-like [Dreissena polymorpha]